MIATTFFLDSRFTMRTRLCRALNLADALRHAGIVVACFVKLVTRETFMPFHLVLAADLETAVLANSLSSFARSVNLPATAIWTGTPDPVLIRLALNLQCVRFGQTPGVGGLIGLRS